MKNLIIILLLIPIILQAQDIGGYYVAHPDSTYEGMNPASDLNDGSYANPWATWLKGFESISSGDTLYLRGGVYNISVTNGQGLTPVIADGDVNNQTKLYAYPGETPILDCGNAIPAGSLNYGIRMSPNHTHIRGLTLRNVWSVNPGVECRGWRITGANNTLIENCKVYNIHGSGFGAFGDRALGQYPSNFKFLNCDAWNCCDSLAVAPQLPGNKGTGFSMNFHDTLAVVYYENCRAWLCGDQGFTGFSSGYSEHIGCYSFNNGMLQGGGHGFKLGYVPVENELGPTPAINRYLRNCVAAYNRHAGFVTNDDLRDGAVKIMAVNNIAYANAITELAGFTIFDSNSSQELQEKREFYNNIAYMNVKFDFYKRPAAYYTHSHNVKGDGVWDLDIPITDADFVSVDSTGLTAPRQADGSLPDNQAFTQFLHLASTSGLIDAGTDVGLPYNGTAPDLGAFEYTPAATKTYKPGRSAGGTSVLNGKVLIF